MTFWLLILLPAGVQNALRKLVVGRVEMTL